MSLALPTEAAPERPPAPEPPASESTPAAARLRGDVAWNAASDLAARGASLWVSFFCARQLGVEDFGRFTFALGIVQYVWLAGDATANSGYATRELTHARHAPVTPLRGIGDPFLRARLAAAAVLTLVVLVAAWALPMAPALKPVLAAGSAYFLAYAAYPDWALRGLQDFRRLCVANVVYAVALIASTAWLLPRTHSPAVAALAWSASFAAAAAVGLPALVARGVFTARPAARGAWRTHARRSMLFSLGAIAGIGSVQTPLLLSGALATPHEAGLFAAAFRLMLVPFGVFSVLWWPLFPLLARLEPGTAPHRRLIADAAALVAAAALPPALACVVLPAPLLTALFGAAYAHAAPSLVLCALALPLYAVSGLLEQVALAAHGEVLRLRVYSAASAVILVVGLVAVPRLGAFGGALALFAGFAAAAIAWSVALREWLPVSEAARRVAPLLPLVAALGVAWVAGARWTPLPPLAVLAIGAALYAAAAFGLRLVPLLGDARRRS